MRDVMEAADVTEVSNAAETAMDGAGAVEAAMEGVSASVAAAVSSPVPSTTVSASVAAAVSSPVPSTTMSAAVTAASGRDGRGESRRDKRARDRGCDDHCSKHGAVSSLTTHWQQC
jgi:hypothetical protein